MRKILIAAMMASVLAGCASSGNQQLKMKLKLVSSLNFRKVKQPRMRLNLTLVLLMLFHILTVETRSGSTPLQK